MDCTLTNFLFGSIIYLAILSLVVSFHSFGYEFYI